MNTNKRGAATEHLVISTLLEDGWEVFYNTAPTGPSDLVLWDKSRNILLLVDVKTVTNLETAKNQFAKKIGKVCVIGYDPDAEEWDWLKYTPAHEARFSLQSCWDAAQRPSKPLAGLSGPPLPDNNDDTPLE